MFKDLIIAGRQHQCGHRWTTMVGLTP